MYKRKTKLSPIHISLIALAILVVIAVIVTFAVKKDEPKEPAAQSGIVYDDSAIEGGWETLSQEEIEQRLNDKVQAGMINISCNTAPYFKDGKSEGNVMLVNELNNLYPQKVEFYYEPRAASETVPAAKRLLSRYQGGLRAERSAGWLPQICIQKLSQGVRHGTVPKESADQAAAAEGGQP